MFPTFSIFLSVPTYVYVCVCVLNNKNVTWKLEIFKSLKVNSFSLFTENLVRNPPQPLIPILHHMYFFKGIIAGYKFIG